MLSLLFALQAAAPHDALRYDITLIPSDTGTHLLGEVETAWRLASADPVAVQLDSSMRVVRVLIDGRPNTRLSRTMYGRSDHDLVVPHQKQAGDSITTRIRYHGFARGKARVGANRRGEPAFSASGADDGARFWLPVPENPASDFTLAGFRIQAPVAHRAIAPGALVRVDTLPYGDAVWIYRLDVPVPVSALDAATGAYEVRALTGSCGQGCSRVEVWTYPGGKRDLGEFDRAPAMVEFMSRRLGPYPYGRLAHVEAPVATVVAGPGVVLHPEASLGGGRPTTEAMVRATAQQWFGVAVVPATPADRWITEDIAGYLERLWRDPSGESVTASRLHGLRKTIGDSAFFGGLRRVVETYRERPVTHASFMRAMSEVAGKELDLTRP